MEVGKYIDFHNSDADATDFAVRITSNGANIGIGTDTPTSKLDVNGGIVTR